MTTSPPRTAPDPALVSDLLRQVADLSDLHDRAARVRAVAREADALQARVRGTAGVRWESTAADAFRHAVEARCRALVAVVTDLESLASALDRHATQVRERLEQTLAGLHR